MLFDLEQRNGREREKVIGVGEDEGKRLTVNTENALIHNMERRSA
jgi:hypothetical protein